MESKSRRIIFLGGIFSEKNSLEILNNSNGVVQNAADALQKSFIKGIKEYNLNIVIFNLPFIGSYPSLYNKLFIRFEDDTFNEVKVKNIPFVNLKGYKIFSRFINLYKKILNIRDSTFVIYSINISFLLAVYLNKVFNKSNRIILIIPDLPEFMNSKNTFLKKCILKFQKIFFKKCIFPKVDCFVLLTEQMGDRLALDKSKVKIIEGIFSDDTIEDNRQDEDKFRILYTGTLAKRYGVLDLLHQFSRIEDDDIELLICGAGDGEHEILQLSSVDKRIKFLGQLQREKILELQRSCSLLVNPRKNEEFTKYSFPSKTMEYFASGTPVLMYKLSGVPLEYYDFCFVAIDSENDSLFKQILKIKEIPFRERRKIGLQAQQFILNKKNAKEQVKKIKYFIK